LRLQLPILIAGRLMNSPFGYSTGNGSAIYYVFIPHFSKKLFIAYQYIWFLSITFNKNNLLL